MRSGEPADGHTGAGFRLPGALALGLAVLLAGCGLSGPEDEGQGVPMAVSTTSSRTLVQASRQGGGPSGVTADAGVFSVPGASRAVTVGGSGGDTLVIDFVALLVDDGRLAPRTVEACGGDSACAHLQSRATGFTIPLDGETRPQLETRVGVGLYDRVSFRLITASASDSALLDSLPEFEGQSILVKGSFNDEPFTVTRDLTGTVEFTITPGLDITESTNATNLTLSTTVTSWYQLADGSVLDPRQATGRLTEELIEASTSAFPDQDGDGEPDRTGPGSQ